MNANRLCRVALSVLVSGTLLLTSGCLKTIYVASADGYVNTKATGTGRRFTATIPNKFYLLGTVPRVNVIEVDRAVSWALRRDVRYITGLEITQRCTFLNAIVQVIKSSASTGSKLLPSRSISSSSTFRLSLAISSSALSSAYFSPINL